MQLSGSFLERAAVDNGDVDFKHPTRSLMILGERIQPGGQLAYDSGPRGPFQGRSKHSLARRATIVSEPV